MEVSGGGRTSRRALLGLGALGVLGLTTGCGRERGGVASDSSSAPPPALPTTAETDDRRLVSGLYGDLASRTDELKALRRRRPGLRKRTAQLAGLHDAHLAALGALLGEGSAGWFAGVNRADLETAEISLATEFSAAVPAAQDGAIARVVASLAAGQAVAVHALDPAWESPSLAVAAVPDGEVDTLQAALAVEHAAVFVFGVLGGRTSAAEQKGLFEALTAAFTVHRDRRDALTRSIGAAGSDPVAAAAGYAVAGPPTTPDEVRAAAVAVESATCEQYAGLVAAAAEGRRAWPAAVMTEAAQRAVDLGGEAAPFPGAPELAL